VKVTRLRVEIKAGTQLSRYDERRVHSVCVHVLTPPEPQDLSMSHDWLLEQVSNYIRRTFLARRSLGQKVT
jgi:hypothetical protein